MAVQILGGGGGSSYTPVPLIVASGVTYTVPDNQQALYALPIYVQAGGVIATTGTGCLAFVL